MPAHPRMWTPGPATAELRSLHSTIGADGGTVARFGFSVCPDQPDRTGPQAPPSWIANQAAAAKLFQKVMRGVAPNWGQTHDWGQTRNWVVEAGFPRANHRRQGGRGRPADRRFGGPGRPSARHLHRRPRGDDRSGHPSR